MSNVKRGWHNPSKYIETPTEGKCPYCHKHVKSLKNHIHDKHKAEKLVKEKIMCYNFIDFQIFRLFKIEFC